MIDAREKLKNRSKRLVRLLEAKGPDIIIGAEVELILRALLELPGVMEHAISDLKESGHLAQLREVIGEGARLR